jgi:hypothetical protein
MENNNQARDLSQPGEYFQARILAVLIDWYENSPAYIRGQKPARRRIMRLYDGGSTDFPEYDIENHTIREDVNNAVLDLYANNYIGYQWMRGQQGHIIAKLWLNAESIPEAYARLSRKPKWDITDELLNRLDDLMNRVAAEWARLWAADTMAIISKRRGSGALLPEDPLERDDLLLAIASLAEEKEIETLERVFSMRCYGDSKRFERGAKGRLIRILKKYGARDDECTDEDALRLAGIVQYPEQFVFLRRFINRVAERKNRIFYSTLWRNADDRRYQSRARDYRAGCEADIDN